MRQQWAEVHCELVFSVLHRSDGGLHSTATCECVKGTILLGLMRACLAHAGKPSKDSGSGTQEQTYVKTVIELHDKYLQVCSLFTYGPTSCSSCLYSQVRRWAQAGNLSARSEAELSDMASHGALRAKSAADNL